MIDRRDKWLLSQRWTGISESNDSFRNNCLDYTVGLALNNDLYHNDEREISSDNFRTGHLVRDKFKIH